METRMAEDKPFKLVFLPSAFLVRLSTHISTSFRRRSGLFDFRA